MSRLPPLTETGALVRVVLKHACDAFVSRHDVDTQWRARNFRAKPDLERALAEYDAFAQLIIDSGTDVFWLSRDDRVGLDSIYVRDIATLVPDGVVLCRMTGFQRHDEPAVLREAIPATGVTVAGHIIPPGTMEGGDVVWLDSHTVVVGRGDRTSETGIAQFAGFAGPDVDVVTVPLPQWRGPGDVPRLMSIISPIDRDLAVVYRPLMPAPFMELLAERGVSTVDVPHDEFESMGASVLALGPRRCLMLDNPVTRRRLERAGAEVQVYPGREICLKGGRGPTCLTRPLVRAH